MRSRVSPIMVAVAIFLVSLLATSYVSQSVFEGIPHLEDEVAFLFQAKTFAAGRLYVTTPAHLEFFNLPFLIDHDHKWFGKYPPGYPSVLAIGVVLGQPWLINPLAASASLVLVYLIGRRLYGEGTGIVAAALGLVSPFFLLQSGTLMSHPTTLLFVTVFVYSFIRMLDGNGRAFALAAGASLGMAFLSRQLTAVGVAIPFVLYGLWRVMRDPRCELGRYAWLVAAFAPFCVALLAYNAILTGSPFTSTYELYWPYDKIGLGQGVGPGDGHTLDMGLLNTKINLSSLSTHLFGWPWKLDLAPLAVAALGLAISAGKYAAEALWPEMPKSSAAQKRASLWEALLLAMVISLVGVHVLYWTYGFAYGPRYYFESLPALLLLSSRGLVQVATLGWVWSGRVARETEKGLGLRWAERWAPLAGNLLSPAGLTAFSTFTAVAVLVAYSLITYLPVQFDTCRGQYGISGEAPRLVSKLNLGRSIVFVPPGKNWTDHASLLTLNSPTLDSETIFALDFGPDHNQLLIRQYPDRRVLYWRNLAGQ